MQNCCKNVKNNPNTRFYPDHIQMGHDEKVISNPVAHVLAPRLGYTIDNY